MSDVPEQVERELRIALMQADIANEAADTALKNEQRRWEPWKMLATAAGASAALFGALGFLVGYLLAQLR